VKAANNDGVWNETGAVMAIGVPPLFYETRWFAALCVALAAGLMWLIYLWRLRMLAARMHRLHEERLDERMRIARELHDTLLQGFVSASMQLHVLGDRLPSDSPDKPLLTRVLQRIAAVTEEGRNAVRGLRLSESGDSVEDAFTGIKQELAPDTAIGFRVIAGGHPRRLYPLIRDEIHRIGREALINAFRHSGAQHIEVEIEYRDDRLTLRVRDDGRGIDTTKLEAVGEHHWGLAGMQERAGQIGAKLKVTSRSGAGTEIELSIPGKVAYQTVARPWVKPLLHFFAGKRAGNRPSSTR
jgi:signal transduction histidine kinase